MNAVAKQITVQINGETSGSGFILERRGNTYYVVTNRHVAEKPGRYEITTADGRIYPVYYSDTIPDLDLMVLQFETNRSYTTAKLGNSHGMTETDEVYIAGWTAPDALPGDGRGYEFTEGRITTIKGDAEDGYSFVYTNQPSPGTSGGPILNRNGEVLGINGQGYIQPDTYRYIGLGIPIHLFLAKRDVEKEVEPIRSPDNFSLVRTISAHSEAICIDDCIAISPDGNILVTGSVDNTIKVWNLATGKLLNTLTGHSDMLGCVAISPNGETLVSGSLDNTIKVWNLATGTLKTTLASHSDYVSSLAISLDGNTLVSGSLDNTIKVWNLATGKLKTTLTGHSDQVRSVAISSNGETLVSGSKDKTIKVWNLATESLKTTLTGHSNLVHSVAISPDGETLVSGSWDNTIKVWDLATGSLKTTLASHGKDVNSVAISPDGQTLVSGSWDKTIKVWNLATGSLKTTLTGHSNLVWSVAISPDGQTLVSGDSGGNIKIWQGTNQ